MTASFLIEIVLITSLVSAFCRCSYHKYFDVKLLNEIQSQSLNENFIKSRCPQDERFLHVVISSVSVLCIILYA